MDILHNPAYAMDILHNLILQRAPSFGIDVKKWADRRCGAGGPRARSCAWLSSLRRLRFRMGV